MRHEPPRGSKDHANVTYDRGAVTGRLLVVVVAGVLLAGCGDGDDAATVVIGGLQTEQGTLIGNICGFPGAPVDRPVASRARRQLNVLLRELRARPGARVRTFYYADDSLFEKGGRKRETLSLRELAQREIDTDRELRAALEDTNSKSARCARSLTARLSATLT